MSISEKILHDMQSDGFYLSSVEDKNEFEVLCQEVGDVVKYTDVIIDKNKPWYLNKADPFPLHTDDPSINIVAWYCLKQDYKHGETLIVDARKVINLLSESVLERLSTIKTRVQVSEARSNLLISKKPVKLYYAPWSIEKKYLNTQQEYALHEFEKAISEEEIVIVKLQPYDIIFLNNNFMLHGRNRISDNSERHLIRAYIKS